MTIEEAQRRIVARMTESERAMFEQDCQVVDFYMAIACDANLPPDVQMKARDVLRACATRQPHQTVADVVGKPSN